jgi:hypothetical protein
MNQNNTKKIYKNKNTGKRKEGKVLSAILMVNNNLPLT